jgi:peptide/nickel transport system substrate-binding protein
LFLTTTAAFAEAVTGGKLNLIVQPEPPSIMIGTTTNGPALLVAAISMRGCCATTRP